MSTETKTEQKQGVPFSKHQKHPLQQYLENQGYTIRYRHCRYRETPEGTIGGPFRKHQIDGQIYNFGGRTECIILSPDNSHEDEKPILVSRATGTAVCSFEDNYCKAEGRKYALLRAYRKLQNQCLKCGTSLSEVSTCNICEQCLMQSSKHTKYRDLMYITDM